jgi:hypothetical protein
MFYTFFLQNCLNVLLQILNEMGLQKIVNTFRVIMELFFKFNKFDFETCRTDATSRQRERLTETRQQLSDRISIYSQVPQWARYQDALTN